MKSNKTGKRAFTLAVTALLLVNCMAGVVRGGDSKFKIAIMQAKKGEAKKYAPLVAYMKDKGVEVSLIGAKSYNDAAQKFSAGKVDVLLRESSVEGSKII